MNSSLYYFGLIAMIAILVVLAARAVLIREDLFKYPAVVGLFGLAWIVPQAIAIEGLRVNFYATELFWLYVAACLLFLTAGFRYGQRIYERSKAGTGKADEPAYDLRRLKIVALVFALIGASSLLLMGQMDLDALGSQWTGQAAFLALLSKTLGLALCLSVILYAKTGSRMALGVALFALALMVPVAFGAVRRELLFDIFVLTIGVWAFVKRRYPPRLAVISAIVVGTIVLNSAGNLRAYVESGEGTLVDALTSADTYTSFSYFEPDEGNANELRQAQFDHWRVNQTGSVQYGAGYWNKLVHLYVPAFIVGRGVKDGLKIPITFSDDFGRIRSELDFQGSTRTGFSDSYVNFGPLGILVFFLIGTFFGYFYFAAANGSLFGQFLYFSMFSEGLKAITHSTAEFIAILPFNAALILAGLWFAKSVHQRSARPPHLAPNSTPYRNGGANALTAR